MSTATILLHETEVLEKQLSSLLENVVALSDSETCFEESKHPNITLDSNLDEADNCFKEEDDDKQVLKATFQKLDINGNGKLSWNEIEAFLREFPQKGFINNIDLVETLKNSGATETDEIDVEKFESTLRKFPRAHGQRIQWARSLNLDTLFASLLPPGTLYDELAGIKELDHKQIKVIFAKYMQYLEKAFTFRWEKLKQENTAQSLFVDDVMNKFSGDLGKFGDPAMFHEGLENQIGSPDPFVLKAILREHLGDGSEVNQITSNYKIIFNNVIEFSRLFGHPQEYDKDFLPKASKLDERDICENPNIPIFLLEVAKGLIDGNGPSMAELRDLQPEFEKLQIEYKRIVESSDCQVFPGDFGDAQLCMRLTITSEDVARAKLLHADLKLLHAKPFRGAKFIDAGFPPSGSSFTVSVYGSFSFFNGDDDKVVEEDIKRMLEQSGSLVTLVRSDVVLLYGDFPHEKDQKALLKDFLMGMDLWMLSKLSGLRGNDSKDAHVSRLVEGTFDCAPSTGSKSIVLMQGRRRLSLRELMNVPEVKKAGLRFEEAVQAYQYTGPLFQENVRFARVHLLTIFNS
jgi:hypothetical protein